MLRGRHVGGGGEDISKSRSGVLDFIKLEEGEQLLRPLLKVGVRFVESKWMISVSIYGNTG